MAEMGRRARVISVFREAGIARDTVLEKRQHAARTLCLAGHSGIAESRADRCARDQEKRKPKIITVVGAHGDPGVIGKRDRYLYFSTAERNEAMGIDWMKGGEISQAIPPAYTEFVGHQLMAILTRRAGGSEVA